MYKVKNNLYKVFCQATNSPQRVNLHQKFKNYKNWIITLNCLCKEDYKHVFKPIKKIQKNLVWCKKSSIC